MTKIMRVDYNSWGDEIHLFPYVQIKNKMILSICEANGFHLNYTAFINLLLLRKILMEHILRIQNGNYNMIDKTDLLFLIKEI